MSADERSGVDLARVALRAAREAARKNSVGRKTKAKPRMARTVRRDGREPMGLGAAIGALVTERAWELPAAGASLRERWAAIAPKLAAHVAAVGYDADAGQLTVCPESSAWATQTRLEQTRVVEVANESAGRTVVRSLRILTPGTMAVPEPADADPEPAAAPAGPVRTRETASPGYRRALAALQEVAPPRRADPAITDAVERQSAAMRELSRRAFPDPEQAADGQPTPSSRPTLATTTPWSPASGPPPHLQAQRHPCISACGLARQGILTVQETAEVPARASDSYGHSALSPLPHVCTVLPAECGNFLRGDRVLHEKEEKRMPERPARLRIRQTPARPPLGPQPRRARQPAGRASQIVRWYRNSDWARHTAVLAAVVSAIGLAVTAWGTYKTAQVANDQLAESREQDERNARLQASQVTMWLEPDALVLANRSLDPALVYFQGKQPLDKGLFAQKEGVPDARKKVVFTVRIGTIPPCTRVAMPRGESNHIRIGVDDLLVEGLLIVDAEGTQWLRSADGPLRRYKLPGAQGDVMEEFRRVVQETPGQWGLSAQNVKGAKFTSLDSCGKPG
ncbi:DciA family protein [Streptomyces sp. NPDC014685]|uniref:DciA family protein n=1 Tax=Streptomyces sp. NPDC014685 TaxID=3364881 RepID=UPI0036F93A49